jgi:RHS repeat-associated protein
MQRPSLRLRLHVLLLVGVSLVASGLPAAEPAVAASARPSGLTDQHGSLLGTVSENGAISDLVRYDPYGLARPGSAVADGIGFTGEWANATGLVNLRFRQYDPLLGRFTGRDSFAGLPALPQSANRYAFGLGNPLLARDPSGHFSGQAGSWSFDFGGALEGVATFLNSPEGQSFAASLLTLGASDAASAVVGHDIITGRGLSFGERLLRFAAFLPAVGLALKALERFAPRILEALRIASRIIKGERPGAIVAELRAARGLLASDAGSLSLGRIWDRIRGVTGGRTAARATGLADNIPAFARSQYGRPSAAARAGAFERAPTCPYCGQSPSTQVDHIRALRHDWGAGGWADDLTTRTTRVNDPANLIGSCPACNAAKQARPIGEGSAQWWPPAWPSGSWWPFGGGG